MAQQKASGNYSNPYLFNGKELDEETGLYYYGARYYNLRYSLWLGVDAMVEKHPDYTPYSFVYNNPVRYFDPLGLDTAFVSQSDRDFVLDLINPQSLNYSKEYAGKFQDLVDSKTMYKFESYKAGTKHNGQPGKTYVDANNPNQINIDFTKGDDNFTQDPFMGGSIFRVLFEETFHAWDYQTGGLNFNLPTCMNEAKAWKFAATASGTYDNYPADYNGKTYQDITVMSQIRDASVMTVANWFKNGMMPGRFDSNNGEFRTINASQNPLRGLYHGLPLK